MSYHRGEAVFSDPQMCADTPLYAMAEYLAGLFQKASEYEQVCQDGDTALETIGALMVEGWRLKCSPSSLESQGQRNSTFLGLVRLWNQSVFFFTGFTAVSDGQGNYTLG